ncbi:hypothetical protein MMC25_007536 [Agyrium rufum]|nr:hypothetical protein [Agyrium rufum]
MDSRKGKLPERRSNGDQGPLATRIISSATNLLRATVTTSSGSEASSSLSSALPSSKGESSSQHRSHGTSLEHEHDHEQSRYVTSSLHSPPSAAQTFRTSESEDRRSLQQLQGEFDSFGTAARSSSMLSIRREGQIDTVEFFTNDQSSNGALDVRYHANPEDGAAVVALLSDPTFSTDDDPSVFPNDDDDEDGSDEAAASLFTPPASSIGTSSYLPQATGSTTSGTNPSSTPLPQTVLLPTFPNSEPFDVRPWLQMSTRYHDEVWGDLLPLIQDAREEELGRNGERPGKGEMDGMADVKKGPAVRRLEMVLRHLKG